MDSHTNKQLQTVKFELKKERLELKLNLQRHIKTPGWLLEFCVNYTQKEVTSRTFYTQPHGYRMCICLYSHGTEVGKGTHVSIFTYMMRGPFDDHLKWLFRGIVTIQLVNQAGDHDHFEKTIRYTDTTPDVYISRVTGSDMAGRERGYTQYLSHADLGYNAARKTQYLKDDHLIVRVVKVIVHTEIVVMMCVANT